MRLGRRLMLRLRREERHRPSIVDRQRQHPARSSNRPGAPTTGRSFDFGAEPDSCGGVGLLLQRISVRGRCHPTSLVRRPSRGWSVLCRGRVRADVARMGLAHPAGNPGRVPARTVPSRTGNARHCNHPCTAASEVPAADALQRPLPQQGLPAECDLPSRSSSWANYSTPLASHLFAALRTG